MLGLAERSFWIPGSPQQAWVVGDLGRDSNFCIGAFHLTLKLQLLEIKWLKRLPILCIKAD